MILIHISSYFTTYDCKVMLMFEVSNVNIQTTWWAVRALSLNSSSLSLCNTKQQNDLTRIYNHNAQLNNSSRFSIPNYSFSNWIYFIGKFCRNLNFAILWFYTKGTVLHLSSNAFLHFFSGIGKSKHDTKNTGDYNLWHCVKLHRKF